VGRVRVREVGSKTFVDLGVAVPRHLSFEESHAVTREVQDAVLELSPEADVVVHTTPVAESEGFLERVEAVAAQGHFAIHNITTHLAPQGLLIDLDLEVDPNLPLERAHALATELELRLSAEFGGSQTRSARRVADVNVHLEPRSEEMIRGAEMSAADAARYIVRIEAVGCALPHAHGIQDVHLQKLDRTVYLSLHLLLDPDVPVREVHEISEEMESRLRREFPQLGRVVIHAEPFVETRK
jgi:divalent metal cation (Fe/Co/Zn/Cd) transporter